MGKKLKTLKLSMLLDVDEDKVDEILKLTHHIDYLVDLDSFPEIKGVSNVMIEEPIGKGADTDHNSNTQKKLRVHRKTLYPSQFHKLSITSYSDYDEKQVIYSETNNGNDTYQKTYCVRGEIDNFDIQMMETGSFEKLDDVELWEETWFTYNSDNQLINTRTIKGDHEVIRKKYIDGNITQITDNKGYWRWEISDENDYLIVGIDKNGVCIYFENEYDINGNIIHRKSNDIEEWFEYNDDNTMKHSWDNDGKEFFYKYDSQGNLIKTVSPRGLEEIYKYDDLGRVILYTCIY